jgi:alanyl-tRNA synthetase
MATKRLYYDDPRCRAFDAVVTRAFEHGGRAAVVLDRTAFYPTSGGQPFDTGRLSGVDVVDTIDLGDEVAHVLAGPIGEGASVRGEIDWARRSDHMQQHTGQHILSAAFERLFGNPTVGFHMGADASTIDLARDAPAAAVEQAVEETNRVVWEDRQVSIRFAPAGEVTLHALRREPARRGEVRLIDIDGYDVCPCGGTHVTRTGAIGLVAVLGSERVRGGTRLTFVCGGRALAALRSLRDAVGASVRVLSVLPQELPAAIERLQAESRDLRKALGRLQASLAAHEAARLLAGAADVSGTRVAVEVMDGWEAAGLKAVAASAIAQGGAVVVLVSAATPAAVVVARSPGLALDAPAVLGRLLDRFGGRGGGRPDLAQGGGLAGDPAAIAAAARDAVDAWLAGTGR